MHYTVSETSLQIRKKNILLGAFFSLLLVAAIVTGHMQYPKTYDGVLLWSVAAFVVLGNLINYYRYNRYLRLVRDHRIETDGDKVLFWTNGERSVLDVKDITMLTFYRRKGALQHIQLKLKSNRGIRLEGYGELEQLGRTIADRIPKEQVIGREP
ncbi:MAG: hypothetical protein JMN27_17450 [gamma proteobacterium endosymbiont of Lamellibrachia anaximandri]|nr:hypothetical protein [gamma proteobacterium endosymbiont of Lamellibrachia anaximandri]MBL3535593.1 hypothetical protein [gamma proteobacterium endosymbiont of Lamellibrachia anaximandri]